MCSIINHAITDNFIDTMRITNSNERKETVGGYKAMLKGEPSAPLMSDRSEERRVEAESRGLMETVGVWKGMSKRDIKPCSAVSWCCELLGDFTRGLRNI